MLDRRPEEVIRKAVKGMLPRNRLARQQLTKLKVYAGTGPPPCRPNAQADGNREMTDEPNNDEISEPQEPETDEGSSRLSRGSCRR